MTAGEVQTQREGHVATLRFSNPPRHTLTAGMVGAMRAQLAALHGQADLRVVVLRSATPGVFITHYEVGELAAAAERTSGEPSARADGQAQVKATVATASAPDDPQLKLHVLHQLILELESLPAVTVAVMDGLAMGGGLELALGCDFRLLREGPHVVGLPETSVGIIPGAGGTQRLARLLGSARALDLILHGTLLRPQEALAAGMVHRVLAAESFDADAEAFVRNLAARAPIALAQAKRAIREGAGLPLREALVLEQAAFERTMASTDARLAMRAYLKGERYEWKGE
jgi:enoyl-CoA hydratase/carnithine racemase